MSELFAAFQAMLPGDLAVAIGIRELILLLVVLLVVYMLVVVLRMKSLSGQRRFDEIAAARYEDDLHDHLARKKGKRPVEVEVSLSEPIVPGKAGLDDFYGATKIEPRTKYSYEPPESAAGDRRSYQDRRETGVTSFDQEKLTRLERELSSTRDELDALRTAFSQTRDAMQKEIDSLKATQRVSPIYGDSLQMAMSGATAEEIAARCGIARAEAELVLSMARGAGGKLPGEVAENGAAGRGNDDGRSGRSRYGSY